MLTDPALIRDRAYINGVWRQTTHTLSVVNPANGERLADVPDCSTQETLEAVDAASAAFRDWSARPAVERARLLEAWHDAIIAQEDDLARLMTLEQGKPLAEARAEVRYGASFLKWFAEEARRVYGDTIPAPTRDRRIIVLKQPVGVVAIVTPWNFPIAMITRKAGAALAAGCTLVLKPSELTPLSALAIAALAERVGVPAGVVNVVTGQPAPIGAVLTSDPRVRKLSFTGSTAVGQHLMAQSAGTLKRLSLELGGNAPFIVFEDANLDLAVQGVMVSKFRNAGQTCVCANRILVESSVYDAFAARLTTAVAQLVVGNGLDEGVTVGPLINARAKDKVLAHIDDALSKGAVARGAEKPDVGGQFVTPTVLLEATADMRVSSEETFGPVAPLFRFTGEDEAIAMANSTPHGLAAYFYTEQLSRTWRVAERLECGMVGVNTGSVSLEVAPFGGVKASGFGREGSKYGLDDYLQLKALHIGHVE